MQVAKLLMMTGQLQQSSLHPKQSQIGLCIAEARVAAGHACLSVSCTIMEIINGNYPQLVITAPDTKILAV